MYGKFEALIGRLVGGDNEKPLSGIEISGQLRPDDASGPGLLRNLNAAFLIALSGVSHPRFEEAVTYLQSVLTKAGLIEPAGFFIEGLGLIRAEVDKALEEDASLREDLDKAFAETNESVPARGALAISRFFFPEGDMETEERDEDIRALREKRTVKINKLNPTPIGDPAREVLLTSNVLLGVPLDESAIDAPDLSPELKERIRKAAEEEQAYWYDHPIPVGTATEKNEAVYGLRALDKAAGFEKERGTVKPDDKLTVVLSVSVTHKGLHSVAGDYLRAELRRAGGLKNLRVFIFTEADTKRLLREVLIAAAERYFDDRNTKDLEEVFGVDGKYGRHYSFLKSVSALWQVLEDPAVRATFKTDLDQVFPQKELTEQTGSSALEHLMSPLWGAEGTDSSGRPVVLGMLAGALVNECDIAKSIHYPDVLFPKGKPRADEAVFQSVLPQALSTEAEMMTLYTGEGDSMPDGKGCCLERIHVTGGTCGILIDQLREYRPFTPVFMGRAEDQAYILSVLFKEGGPYLRYLHKDGLIMRHDKDSFAGEAIEAATLGKTVGDYVRVLYFTHYARALPWPLKETKDTIDPFTGCFVSRIPFTVVHLRLALRAAAYFGEKTRAGEMNGAALIKMGTSRLKEAIRKLNVSPNPLINEYLKEKNAWDLYFDTLEELEAAIKDGDEFALKLKEKTRAIIKSCRLI